MTSRNNRALYIGVTNNLMRRVQEYKSHAIEGFTKKYNCVELVYVEEASSADDAIAREKQLKKWSRSKKENLIKMQNPEWKNLSRDWF